MSTGWGGRDRVGDVIEVTKKGTVGTFENKIKTFPGDVLVAVAHSGDWFFDWMVLRKDRNTNQVPFRIVSDYGQDGKRLGKITKASLYSCLNEFYNPCMYGTSYLSYHTE